VTVRIGLIGLGNWGGRLANALATVDDVELTACFARTSERRAAFAAEHGCVAVGSMEELFDSVDGVLIATPHSTHVALIEAAASAGVHIMVEKPLTLSVSDGRRAIAAAEGAGVLLQVAHYRRRFAPVRRIKAMIEAGEIGTLLQVDGHFSKPIGYDSRRPWRNDPAEQPAGAMTALGVHTTDDLMYLAGPIRRLWALSSSTLGDTALDDATTVLLEFGSGVQGTMRMAQSTPTVATVSVFGTKAAARSDDDGHRLFTTSLPDDAWAEQHIDSVDGVAANLSAFVHSVRTGEHPETDGLAGLRVVAVMEGIVASSAAGGVAVDVAIE
jgi:predicted dehydrogenase